MTATPALLLLMLAESEAEAVIRLEQSGARAVGSARRVSDEDADLLARPISEGLVRRAPNGALYVDMPQFTQWQAERRAAETSTPASRRMAIIGGLMLLVVVAWFAFGAQGR